MNDHFNPAKHSWANRFRLRLQEILLGTPKSRIRPNPAPFNHLIFSTRYKKPPSPRVLTYNLPFAFPSPAKVAIRRKMAIPSESAAADEPRGVAQSLDFRPAPPYRYNVRHVESGLYEHLV